VRQDEARRLLDESRSQMEAQRAQLEAMRRQEDVVPSKSAFESIDSKTYVPETTTNTTNDWLTDATAKYGYSMSSDSASVDSAFANQASVTQPIVVSSPISDVTPNVLGDSLSGTIEPKALQPVAGATPDASTAGLVLGGFVDPNGNQPSAYGVIDPNIANPNFSNPVGSTSASLTDGLIGVDGQPVSKMQVSPPNVQSGVQPDIQANDQASSNTIQVPDWLEQATQNLGLSSLSK
jgi:hypothetical protein